MNLNYKHLCIIFPGAAGGNHLNNLLSTCENFTPLWDSNDYINELTSKYNEITKKILPEKDKSNIQASKVHFTKYSNLEFLKIPEERDKLFSNNKINILPGHFHCFMDVVTNNVMMPIEDCFWIAMSVPKLGSLAYKRATQGNFGILNSENYQLPLYIHATHITEENGSMFNTDMFMTVDGWDYTNNFIEENLDISLPKETKKIHEIWINNIIESVKF